MESNFPAPQQDTPPGSPAASQQDPPPRSPSPPPQASKGKGKGKGKGKAVPAGQRRGPGRQHREPSSSDEDSEAEEKKRRIVFPPRRPAPGATTSTARPVPPPPSPPAAVDAPVEPPVRVPVSPARHHTKVPLIHGPHMTISVMEKIFAGMPLLKDSGIIFPPSIYYRSRWNKQTASKARKAYYRKKHLQRGDNRRRAHLARIWNRRHLPSFTVRERLRQEGARVSQAEYTREQRARNRLAWSAYKRLWNQAKREMTQAQLELAEQLRDSRMPGQPDTATSSSEEPPEDEDGEEQ